MRPIFNAPARKVTYDRGTADEQTVTLPKEKTYLEIIFDKVFWFLSERGQVGDNARQPGRFSGSGFYMSGPWAKRVYWIWNGEDKWSMFWGNRTKNNKVIEIWRHSFD